MKICAQKKAGDHQSLACHSRFALAPSAKNEAFKEAGTAQLQPTYPFLEPTFRPKWALSVNVDLGEGLVDSLQKPAVIQNVFDI